MSDPTVLANAGGSPVPRGTCPLCVMDPQFTHSVSEHEVAEALRGPLLQYVRDEAFLGTDNPLTYAEVVLTFGLSTTVRRVGRVLDAVECLLIASGWPRTAAAGVTAYVVSTREGRPSHGWDHSGHMDPRDARAQARAYMHALVMAHPPTRTSEPPFRAPGGCAS